MLTLKPEKIHLLYPRSAIPVIERHAIFRLHSHGVDFMLARCTDYCSLTSHFNISVLAYACAHAPHTVEIPYWVQESYSEFVK